MNRKTKKVAEQTNTKSTQNVAGLVIIAIIAEIRSTRALACVAGLFLGDVRVQAPLEFVECLLEEVRLVVLHLLHWLGWLQSLPCVQDGLQINPTVGRGGRGRFLGGALGHRLQAGRSLSNGKFNSGGGR